MDRIRPITRLLADMQTTINAGGLRAFDGDITRFVVMTVIMRESISNPAEPAPVSINALAQSLSRPFETMRRHVGALIERGLALRARNGVVAAADLFDRPEMQSLAALSHDAFVRLVADAKPLFALDGIPGPAAGRPYDPRIGIQSSVDILLGTAESNHDAHGDWLNLTLFSTTLHGNLQRDAVLSPAERLKGGESAIAVRPSMIARALALPETTVRRRLHEIAGPDRPLVGAAGGYLVSLDWLETAAADAISTASLSNVRRVVNRAVAGGFPLDAPASAYLVGRPPSTVLI